LARCLHDNGADGHLDHLWRQNDGQSGSSYARRRPAQPCRLPARPHPSPHPNTGDDLANTVLANVVARPRNLVTAPLVRHMGVIHANTHDLAASLCHEKTVCQDRSRSLLHCTDPSHTMHADQTIIQPTRPDSLPTLDAALFLSCAPRSVEYPTRATRSSPPLARFVR
jgi:hypothetical protein